MAEYAIESDRLYAERGTEHRVLRLTEVEVNGKAIIRAEEVATFKSLKHAVDWTETYRGGPLRAAG
jgi:hypothetical protein